ncbi:hypothetical protein Rhe02_66520 [Rhizocola hellebori]|uniref:PIN domain-containing protein n=1 Tax=Rhizocola hellebori TaxID=1392758 RepID=A0A8J3QFE1_9ACTN|nr:hypothetical protein [Rhizocola hellebori]GIH08585.1 hypothetical protein Rhe02_66520 [Rhizocola hellebori]
MTIRLILDTSAVAEYVKGSIHVGELLAELHDEAAEVRFAVPVTCLAEAGLAAVSPESLLLLASHQRAAVIPVSAERWRDLVNLTKLMGSVLHAAPFLVAINRDDCYLLTATPQRYPDTDLVIDIGQ